MGTRAHPPAGGGHEADNWPPSSVELRNGASISLFPRNPSRPDVPLIKRDEQLRPLPFAGVTCREVTLQFKPFSTFPLDGARWTATHNEGYTPRKRAPGIHWIGDWISFRTDLDLTGKRIVSAFISPRKAYWQLSVSVCMHKATPEPLNTFQSHVIFCSFTKLHRYTPVCVRMRQTELTLHMMTYLYFCLHLEKCVYRRV
jgi:hypothetical protein